MSFLLPLEDDGMVSVEEAIAFLEDAYSGSSDSSASSAPNDAVVVSSSPSLDMEPGTTQAPTRKKRKAKNPPGYSTKLQQRKRAEIKRLKEEIEELTTHLDVLRDADTRSRIMLSERGSQRGQATPNSTPSKWLKAVSSQYRSRLQSEETNRKLRAIMAHQQEVNESLRSVLQSRSLLHGMDAVYANQPRDRHSLAGVENRISIMAHLEEKVASLYINSGSVFQPDPAPCMSNSMITKQHAQLGKMVEAISTTPMPCSMEATADLLWKEYNHERPCPGKWSSYVKASTRPSAMEKSWVFKLQKEKVVKTVNALQLLRKFEEPNRIVFVKTDLITLTAEGLQFRNQGWTIVTRSESDPQHASVVRVCEQIYMDCQQGFSARPEDVAFAQNIVLKNIGWKVRGHLQELQDMLIDKSEQSNIVMPPQAVM